MLKTEVLVWLTVNCNEAIINYEFPDPLKLSNIVPVYKKTIPSDKENYLGQLVFCLYYQKFIKRYFIGSFTNTCITF